MVNELGYSVVSVEKAELWRPFGTLGGANDCLPSSWQRATGMCRCVRCPLVNLTDI